MPRHLRIFSLAIAFFVIATGSAWADGASMATIARNVDRVLVTLRPKQDGILTVRSGTLYVQCINRPSATQWRCEAAGLEGEPWLRNVLTVERQQRLITLGFKPDDEFGNFVRLFPRTTPPGALARLIREVLTEIYGAEADGLKATTDWLPAAPCHPRMIAGHDGGGAIATPQWGFLQDIAAGCRIATNTDGLNRDDFTTAAPGSPPGAEIDLDARYAAPMAAQIARLASGQKHIWAIFKVGIPYVQCEFDDVDKAIYCEAASDDAVGAPLARILTPERRRKLIEAGFEPPGRVVNFSRLYPLDQYDGPAIAHALLAVLHDSYGYGGAPALMLRTEQDVSAPL